MKNGIDVTPGGHLTVDLAAYDEGKPHWLNRPYRVPPPAAQRVSKDTLAKVTIPGDLGRIAQAVADGPKSYIEDADLQTMVDEMTKLNVTRAHNPQHGVQGRTADGPSFSQEWFALGGIAGFNWAREMLKTQVPEAKDWRKFIAKK